MTLITFGMNMHRTALMAHNIVQYAGNYQTEGPFWQRHYTDKKIRIVSHLVPNTEKVGRFDLSFVAIFIRLHGSDDVVYGLPAKPENDETLVYFARQPNFQPEYYRKGRWEKYLDALNSKFRTQADEAEKLHKVPVEDHELFPEFDDE